ncbi:MAG TPA: glycosyltransferase family 4 protein [Steroidobacter sp.]|nr:glycosyltransferase family 4 protein [Steroidobacter sp.]
MLHVAQISFFLDPQKRRPEQLLRDWWSLVDIAEATQGAGIRVSVIQASHAPEKFRRNEVDYYFVQPEPEREGEGIARTQTFRRLLAELKPDVCHVHGLGFLADVAALSAFAPQTPILVQDHAGRPPRMWRRRQWRKALSVVSSVTFCAREQARPYEEARLFHPQTVIYEIPECSTRFMPGEQATARQLTGMDGDPCVLWVGHLDQNKDPLTVLDGVARAAQRLPGLRLWCCFASAALLRQVRNRIDGDSLLAGRVHLVGYVPHERIETMMQAADLFVIGSRREGSGYSLIEALACGLPPVVTDIPSFRSLTGGGAVGTLWPCGDAPYFSEALVEINRRPRHELRLATRAHFDREISFEAVGRKFAAAYADVAQRMPSHSSVVQFEAQPS